MPGTAIESDSIAPVGPPRLCRVVATPEKGRLLIPFCSDKGSANFVLRVALENCRSHDHRANTT